ncbi:MAG TPA: ABC transporter ATP-binding protein [Candidatus Baltobacteraceae bacterium]|nr:ABC transporter ATP-binding protein [Candidatus Baltobacteraceae bacterium]
MIVADRLELRAGDRVLMAPGSFIVEAGAFCVILGANGAGKTTLLRTLAGIRPFSSGTVHVGGRDLKNLTHAERAATISHQTGDDIFFDKLRVADVVAMGRYAHHGWWDWRRDERDDSAVAKALEAVHLQGFEERQFDTLSSGERQRVWIALSLAQEAPVLLLDEPTSHLDVRNAQEVLRLLRSLCASGRTVVCALHDLNEAAAFADKILLIGDGRLLAYDTPERVLAGNTAALAYGLELRSVRLENGSVRIFPA